MQINVEMKIRSNSLNSNYEPEKPKSSESIYEKQEVFMIVSSFG